MSGFIIIILWFPSIGLTEGRVYEHKKEPHCTLWDTMRLKWPQTIMGREKIKCRRRAELSNNFTVQGSLNYSNTSVVSPPVAASRGNGT